MSAQSPNLSQLTFETWAADDATVITIRPICAADLALEQEFVDFGKPAQSCSPCMRRRSPASSGGARSEWAIPRPAVIQLMAPGSIGWIDPMLSRWIILPSKR